MTVTGAVVLGIFAAAMGAALSWHVCRGLWFKRWINSELKVESLRWDSRRIEAIRDYGRHGGDVSGYVLGVIDCPFMNPHHYSESGCAACAEVHLVRVGELLDELIDGAGDQP